MIQTSERCMCNWKMHSQHSYSVMNELLSLIFREAVQNILYIYSVSRAPSQNIVVNVNLRGIILHIVSTRKIDIIKCKIRFCFIMVAYNTEF
jgi:hypothetical protein